MPFYFWGVKPLALTPNLVTKLGRASTWSTSLNMCMCVFLNQCASGNLVLYKTVSITRRVICLVFPIRTGKNFTHFVTWSFPHGFHVNQPALCLLAGICCCSISIFMNFALTTVRWYIILVHRKLKAGSPWRVIHRLNYTQPDTSRKATQVAPLIGCETGPLAGNKKSVPVKIVVY